MSNTVTVARPVMIGLVMASLFVTACGAGADSPVRASGEVEVGMAITPGKPAAPTEQIIVRQSAAGSEIVVRRAAPGEEGTEEILAIQDEAFAKIWKLVRQHGLVEFTPREIQGQVFDFGERRLRISRLDQEDGAPQIHDVSWIQPLENDAGVRALSRELARLARAHASEVSLYYFSD